MKKMKKSMFFSSILMIVILVVALSTSTFAWFTSSSDVSAAATALYSATSADANISIGWAPGQKLTSVSFNPSGQGSAGIAPMIPTTDFTAGATTAQTAAFIKGNANLDGSGDFVFGETPQPASPWTQKQLSGEATTLYIMNWNTLAGATVTITPSVSPVLTDAEEQPIDGATDITDAFRLACWAGTEYLGTFGGTSHWAASWEAGEGTDTLTQTFPGVGSFTFDIDAATSSSSASKQIFLIAWFDGTVLWDDWADQAVTFSLAITAVSKATPTTGD